ncbi:MULTISPECIES: beta-N-acetylhexosaminidase [unclassified Aureimonas]|uniref:beta-N-acetylhexosaminidase n=1 Tax=unclassified Aureimonas TaxID=2615206 RepID=UPI0006F9A9E1|nr:MULTISPECIES: beta-N-acetylhexosaminidase [unclassified Aureimonas]KQT60528.1 beta-hexosaminidase [Aureimonas sp. Leaf427]KQT79405.1 beta-hexosaminidase [Aureimonas sp. Leaf460]
MTKGSKAWIAGCSGLSLTEDERLFFADERPWGYILFGRNIHSAGQLADLVGELKAADGRATVPVFIDQEGGRVQRLRPPIAPTYPPAAAIGRVFDADRQKGERAAWLQGRLIAHDLMGYGINADCLPCLDVPVEGAHSVIGDRAYGWQPDTVATLGRAAADGLVAGGVLPVMKHMPGHGRGNADSHLELPVVATHRPELATIDFVPFQALKTLPAAMTAHLLFTDIDPTFPATLSQIVVESVIRHEIGFDGLLMTDDISMKALAGDIGDLSRQAIAAGCDVVLHCNGDMTEMRKVASAVQPLRGEAERRAAHAETFIAPNRPVLDEAALRAEFDELVARTA